MSLRTGSTKFFWSLPPHIPNQNGVSATKFENFNLHIYTLVGVEAPPMSKWAIRMAKDGAREAMQVRDRARYAASKKIEEDLSICEREKVVKKRLKKQNMKM